jgi:hypothetical protein
MVKMVQQVLTEPMAKTEHKAQQVQMVKMVMTVLMALLF